MPPKKTKKKKKATSSVSLDDRHGVGAIAGVTSRAMEIMAKAPPGTVPFIFALMALFFAAAVVMWIVPKTATIQDVKPVIFAFFGLIMFVLLALMINGGIYRRGERVKLKEHDETFAAIRRLHGA